MVFHLFILDKIGRKNVLDDILQNKKKRFLHNKRSILKSHYIRFFSEGLVYCYDQKLKNFPSFYFRQNKQGKCV